MLTCCIFISFWILRKLALSIGPGDPEWRNFLLFARESQQSNERVKVEWHMPRSLWHLYVLVLTWGCFIRFPDTSAARFCHFVEFSRG